MKSFFLRFGLFLLATCMLIIALYFAFHQPLDSTKPIYQTAPESPYQHTIAGVGIIEPVGGYTQIRSLLTGITKQIYVHTGQAVTKNQRLLQIDHTNIEAPLANTVLKINIHDGEIAAPCQPEPLMILGQLTKNRRVRVEIDETELFQLTTKAPAVGFIRGYAKAIPLTFVHTELIIEPKKSIRTTGDELIDTRVLQIIYEFNNSKINAHLGQLMDIFIQRS